MEEDKEDYLNLMYKNEYNEIKEQMLNERRQYIIEQYELKQGKELIVNIE